MLGLTQVLVVNDTPSKQNTTKTMKYHTKKHINTYTINCVHKVFYNRDLSKWTTKNQNVKEHIKIWVLKNKMQIKIKKIH